MKKSQNQSRTKAPAQGIDRWLDDIARFAAWPSNLREELEREPVDEREALWQAKVRNNLADSAVISVGLARLGIPFALGELAAVRAPYPEAIPLLLEHLTKEHTDDVLATIIRTLQVRYGGRALFDGVYRFLEYYREQRSQSSPDGMSSHLAYVTGDTLAVVAEKANIPELNFVIENDNNGSARLEPLFRLARWKSPSAVAVAKRMLEKGDHPWYALRALRYAKACDAVDLARQYLTHENAEFRAEARRYLAMVDKPPVPSGSRKKET